MSKLAKALTAAAGNAAGESLYVEDVFNTTVYYDTYASSTTNGIDLAGEGGLVWIKKRASVANHFLYDTERGIEKALLSNSSGVEFTATNSLTSFNSDGFSLGTYSNTNSGVAWTFRKAEKFFDVVTYTGAGFPITVSHNLGSVPACIIVKRLDSSSDWEVYHEGNGSNPETEYLVLNTTASSLYNSTRWNSTYPTDSVFSLGSSSTVNAAGATYVAYLFASDAGGFGDDGSESIIKCGSYTASQGVEVDLGFEPQWVLTKSSTNAADWYMFDNMRGWGADRGSNDSWLFANTSGAETNSTNSLGLTPTGFTSFNASGQTYIYIAIRRPMKTPESGTEVFAPTFGTGSGFNFIAGFPVDMAIIKDKDNVVTSYASARLNSGTLLSTASTAAEFANAPAVFDSQVGYYESSLGSNYIGWMFKRATGFFDVVAYTGTGTTGLQVNHNLCAAPEMMIVKNRGSTWQWAVYHKDLGEHDSGSYIASKNLTLNTNDAETTNSVFSQHSDQTASVFTLGYTNSAITYASGNNYIAYLFATLAGVSKVGSYTGNGSNQTIDCGFSAGARFVLIKGTTLSSNWVVFDSERGITVNNDPVLYLNSTIAEFTDSGIDIEPDSSGFIVNSGGNVNASGETYIFLAIA